MPEYGSSMERLLNFGSDADVGKKHEFFHRELVSICSFCLTSMGSEDSALSAFPEMQGRAPLPSPSVFGPERWRRIDFVRSSFFALYRKTNARGIECGIRQERYRARGEIKEELGRPMSSVQGLNSK